MSVASAASLVRLAPVARGSFRPMGFIITDQVALPGAIVYAVRGMQDTGSSYLCMELDFLMLMYIFCVKTLV